MSELPSAALAHWSGAAVGDYVQILKPRVMSLVVFTGIVGLLLAPGHLHPVLAAVAVLCIAIGAGASGAINMWYDRDIDAVMRRTAMRPLPAGRMMPGEALGFGCVLAVWPLRLRGRWSHLLPGLWLALVIEGAHLVIADRYFDVTNGLIAFAGLGIGWLALRRSGFAPFGEALAALPRV